jgi:hypothetical protein
MGNASRSISNPLRWRTRPRKPAPIEAIELRRPPGPSGSPANPRPLVSGRAGSLVCVCELAFSLRARGKQPILLPSIPSVPSQLSMMDWPFPLFEPKAGSVEGGTVSARLAGLLLLRRRGPQQDEIWVIREGQIVIAAHGAPVAAPAPRDLMIRALSRSAARGKSSPRPRSVPASASRNRHRERARPVARPRPSISIRRRRRRRQPGLANNKQRYDISPVNPPPTSPWPCHPHPPHSRWAGRVDASQAEAGRPAGREKRERVEGGGGPPKPNLVHGCRIAFCTNPLSPWPPRTFAEAFVRRVSARETERAHTDLTSLARASQLAAARPPESFFFCTSPLPMTRPARPPSPDGPPAHPTGRRATTGSWAPVISGQTPPEPSVAFGLRPFLETGRERERGRARERERQREKDAKRTDYERMDK